MKTSSFYNKLYQYANNYDENTSNYKLYKGFKNPDLQIIVWFEV